MDSYSSFAKCYDVFMDDIPYEEWAAHLISLFKKYGIEKGNLICDLGCGTGEITKRLFEAGYDMIGIDNSEEMLSIAREKSFEDTTETEATQEDVTENQDVQEDVTENQDTPEVSETDSSSGILYLLQDMREFELYGTVSAIVSTCDVMNYAESEKDLLTIFKLASNYLDEGGYFIFDMKTMHLYRDVLADNVFAQNGEDCSFIWENWFDEKTKENFYDLTLFVKANSGDNWTNNQRDNQANTPSSNTFVKLCEEHVQRAFEIETVLKLLKKAKLEVISVTDGYTGEPVNENSERVLFVARETRHEGKKYI